MKHSKYILFIFCLLSGISCTNDEECRKNRFVNMEIGFYRVTYNETTKLYTTAAYTVDSLTVQGLRVDSVTSIETLVDSVLYNNKKVLSKISLPLNKFENISRFILKFNQTVDTITIFHTNNDTYLSLECGCIKTHNIDTVLTTNQFTDSVRINIHNVNNTNAEHLRLYN